MLPRHEKMNSAWFEGPHDSGGGGDCSLYLLSLFMTAHPLISLPSTVCTRSYGVPK